ncbi:MAG: GNAT family N-acetyltransferase [Marinilabiliaceae bacterium]|nr:GNAT family N-acetyltransferase [Marinilabiliaceae bacterium]
MMPVKTIPITESIVLRQIQTSDAPDIFQTIDRQRQYLGKWLPFVAFTKKEADTFRFIQTIVEESALKREYVFIILHEGSFAGVIGFKDTDRLNQRSEIGYWLAEEMQGKGIVTQAVKKLCQFAFEELGINRIQIKCAAGNFPSKKVPRRLNF